MSPNSEPFSLPHLKPDELADRDHEELVLDRKLASCWHGDELDVERAYQIMRAGAELIFDVTYKAYQGRASYQASWLSAIVKDAVYRTLVTSLPRLSYGVPDSDQRKLGETLKATVLEHVQELENIRLAAPVPVLKYAAAGVDMASASPLLIMAAKAAQHPRPAPSPRKDFVQPLLDAKGWSILDWATEAGLAPHTATDYLSGKTNPYPYSRKKLAEALGISIQQLPK